MNTETADILLIGFGNPGRLDDGLGPALADAIEKLDLPGVSVEADYQLTVEDAADVARHDLVVFADADVAGPEPFWVRRITAGGGSMSFSTHSVEPRAVLALAKDLFGAEPECYIMGIRGYEFNEFGEELSENARANLAAAVSYLERAILERDFNEVRPEGGDRGRRPGDTDK
ncbi:MAG: hydrogenase maturation protease [Planctomycetota bacterium]